MASSKHLFWGRTALLSLLLVAGCQSTSTLTGPSQDLVSATGALVQAESDYFDEIQAASDAGHRLRTTADYVGHNGSFKSIATELAKKDDFGKAKQIRLNALKQLQNYAQVVDSIMTGTDASWVASDASSLTSETNKLLADAGTTQMSSSQIGIVQTAVSKLGQVVIDATSAKELQSLAEQAQQPIQQIANMVDQDNKNIEANRFASSLSDDQTDDLTNILHVLYDDRHVNSAERFTAIQTTMNWKSAVVTKGQAIKAALDKLQAANTALANKPDASAITLIEQAYTLAQQASKTSSTAK